MNRVRSSLCLCLGQAAAIVAALALALLWPPRTGTLLLVPLHGRPPVVQLALVGGARLLGRGPFEGSVVVRGERARLAGSLGAVGIAVVAAPAVLCGKETR